jgi:hypothetical protein
VRLRKAVAVLGALVPQHLAAGLDDEVAAAARTRLDLGLGVPPPDLRGQTGRSRLVVSNDAVLDRDVHGGGGAV